MSPHRVKQASELLDEIDKFGYGNLKVVQDFRADLQQRSQN
jgi:hypothetical protein